MIFIKVDLPAPFSPTSAWISLREAKETPSRARTPPNDFATPMTSKAVFRGAPRPLCSAFIFLRERYQPLRCFQIPSAALSASAPMVDVGLTAALVANELPSTIYKFLTSCVRCQASTTDIFGSVPMRAVPSK